MWSSTYCNICLCKVFDLDLDLILGEGVAFSGTPLRPSRDLIPDPSTDETSGRIGLTSENLGQCVVHLYKNNGPLNSMSRSAFHPSPRPTARIFVHEITLSQISY